MGTKNQDKDITLAGVFAKGFGILIIIVIALFFLVVLADMMFQYNEHGVSKLIGIGIAEGEKEELGTLDGYTVYREDLNSTTLGTKDGGTIELEEAIEEGLIDLKDLCKSAWWKKKVDIDGEKARVYIFENYQILLMDDECIISPKRDYDKDTE